MKAKLLPWLFLFVVPFLAWCGYRLWPSAPAGPAAAAQPQKVLFYQDSMHPWIKSDQPGKCTICGMELTPICEGAKSFDLSNQVVVLNTHGITVLNVQTEPVQRRTLSRTLRVAGTLEANEARKTVISAQARGRIDELAVDYVGVEVEEGQKLIGFFSPELVQQRQYLTAAAQRFTQGAGTNWPAWMAIGNSDPFTSVLRAPLSGVVVERNIYVGQYVAESDRLLTIADASLLWFRFDVYQRQLPWFRNGQTLQVTVPGIPEKVFPARVAFVEPTLNDATRTIKVRADIPNPVVEVNGQKGRQLKFGMYAEGQVRAEVPDVLVVPRSAVLLPGERAYAYVEKGSGAYERRRLQLGRQGDALWEVLGGLAEGERVVTAGNVLIDAQAQFCQADQAEALDTGDMPLVEPGSPAAPGGEGVVQVAMLSHSTGLPAPGPKGAPAAAPMPLMPAGLSATNATKACPILEALIAEADGVSRALAADDLGQFHRHAERWPAVLAPVQKDLAASRHWEKLMEPLAALGRGEPAKDLTEARKRFLPFSTAMVELVQQLKQQDPACVSLKVYHCPMAPKPGLWFQVKGPLRNPYFGARMLQCGEEVPAPGQQRRSPGQAEM